MFNTKNGSPIELDGDISRQLIDKFGVNFSRITIQEIVSPLLCDRPASTRTDRLSDIPRLTEWGNDESRDEWFPIVRGALDRVWHSI